MAALNRPAAAEPSKPINPFSVNGPAGMTTDSSNEPDGTTPQAHRASATGEAVYSPRLRRAGGALLLLTGALGALLGLGLLGYAVLGGFAGVPPVTIALFALPTLLGGGIQLYGGWTAWQGRRWRVAVAAGVVGLLFSPNPVLIPVKVVALAFLGLSEDQFP